jgi:serine/threonine protein kinase/Flp pilus assembly protein TadD
MMIYPIKIFYCYAHEDDALRKQLASHLSPLRRLRDITGWFDRNIKAGAEWEQESTEQLESANIILLLISADFMASDYCYTVEMTRALERHREGTACVIPILLRPVEWERTPLGMLSPLPTNRMPVTQWANPDAAWLNIVQGISKIVRKLLPKQHLSLQDAAILYAEQGPLSGQTIGEKYLLGKLVGEGGFSQVYKAQHLLIQRQQAIKVLLERHFRKQEFRDRFLREAQTVAFLDHPHIIHLDDFWVEASQAYLVMPFMSGGTLQDVLEKQQGFLERDQIVFYLEHICTALDYAHKQGIVHLDLKPLNLLVHEDGRLLLSDFGLAHLMKDGAVAGGSSLKLGTSHYMAPEHIKGFPEKRSDLFSLGVILYQMLVGRLPFDGLPHEAIILKNMTEWPPAPRVLRPELPKSVEDMLGRALAKQPEQRYQTANEFLMAFKSALVLNSHAIVTQHPQKNNSLDAQKSIEIFCCYARQDHSLLLKLKKYLLPLQQEGFITLRADVDISTGTEWKKEIHLQLNTSQIILLLVSPDFMASEYCYSAEMTQAMKRHQNGEAQVVPIILRSISWQKTPFGKLQAFPKNAKPITSRKWHNQDEAFCEVVEELRDVIEASLAAEAQRRKQIFSTAINNADRHRWDSQWEKAVQEYQQALAEFPEDASARSGVGYCYMQMKRWLPSLGEYEQVLRSDPSNVIALSKTAELYVILNRREEAYKACLHLADLYAQANQGARAEAAWQKAVQLSPSNPEPHERLATYYFSKKDVELMIRERLAAAQGYLLRNNSQAARAQCEDVLGFDATNVQAQRLLSQIRSLAQRIQD